MQYLVQMKIVSEGRPKSLEEGEVFFKEFIRPTLDLCKKLQDEEKILAGGPISGTIGLALVVKADSARELDDLVTSLAVWPRMETEITRLTTFGDRAHAHWDHVGGHSYFRSLSSHPKFYGRANYQEEFAREFNGPYVFGKEFFGDRFSTEDVQSYKPDIAIDKRTDLNIGGTKFELIPVRGGETHDAMLIYLPDEKVMFMEDVIMPYLGAPFAQEGDLDGLFDAIDVIVNRNPQYLLQGHEPLTRNFSSPFILSHLKADLTWLQDQVLAAIRRGDDRAAIHDANLIPPDFLAKQPDAYQPYYILREHVIDRLYDQNVGYWQANLQGLAHPSRTDDADLLVDYLSLSEGQILKAAERLSADGKYAMAGELLETAEPKFPHSEALKNAKRFAYLKLMEKNQNTDPFKFIIYSAKAGEQTRQINPDDVKETRSPTR